MSKTLGTEQNEILINRFEQLAEENPLKRYLYYGEDDKSFTYKQFNEYSNSIAHHLVELGVKKGDIVPIFLRNSLVSIISMFSIWKTGSIFSPINYMYTGKFLVHQLMDTKAKIIITERQFIPVLNEIINQTNIETVIVYDPRQGEHDYIEQYTTEKIENATEIRWCDLEHGNYSNPNIELNYFDPANIVYTSGTTGKPKGVLQSHSWINQYTYYRGRFHNENDVVYNDLPLYHVGGVFFNIASATFAGAGIAIWDKFSGREFWKRIETSGATSVLLLDVMIPGLMRAEEKPTDIENTVTKVYMQPLPSYHHKVAKRFGFDIVMTGFGQTEAGQGAVGVIDELKDGEGTPNDFIKGLPPKELIQIAQGLNVPVMDGSTSFSKGFIGGASKMVEIAILNELDEECKVGEVGQICFRPTKPNSMFQEYYNNPEATLEAFKNLWFHTGDAGYLGEDGNYYFVDRLNGVIRVKGEFVSSYQVEDYINGHHNVDVSAVLPIPAEVGDEDEIAAFIVAKDGVNLQEKEIRDWLEQKTPKYMWPKYIRFVGELPKTPSSKIEKYKLRETLEKELLNN